MELRPDIGSLLWPLSEEAFFRRYWTRTPTFSSGDPTRLDALRNSLGSFEPEDLLALRAGDIAVTGEVVDGEQERTRATDDDVALACYRGGSSLLFNLDRTHERVRPWFEGLTAPFSSAANRSSITVICSPPHHGTHLHSDDHEVFNIALTGRKQWTVGDTVLNMNPGFVAYIPQGTPHATQTYETPSVGLTLCLDGASHGEVIADAVSALLSSDPAFAGSSANRTELAERLDALRHLLATVTPEDLMPVTGVVAISAETSLRRSALACRAEEGPALLLKRHGQTEAASIDRQDAALIDWVDTQPSFTPATAYQTFEDRYPPAALDDLFEVLVETGYLIAA